MKILVIHNDYQQPGGETAAYCSDVKILKDAGHTVASYFQDNREILDYNLLKKVTFFPNTFFSKTIFSEIQRLVEKDRPDIAHVHNVFPLISPSVYHALHNAGVPIVQTVHNFRFLCPNGSFLMRGEICERCKFGNTLHAVHYKCYRDSLPLSLVYAITIGMHRKWGTFDLIDRFITHTDFMRKKFVESQFSGPERIAVLGNNIQHPLPEPQYNKPLDGYIAYFGRLSEEKGVSDIIRAVKSINNVKLKIAGDGPDRQSLENLVRILSLNHVEFVGRVSGEEKWNFLRNAKCTILSSRWYENFPISVLESMVVATPVIGSNLGSIPYIVEDYDNGLIYDPRNPGELTDKINWLLSSPTQVEMMARRARETVEQNYTSSIYVQKLVEIYSNVIREKANRPSR